MSCYYRKLNFIILFHLGIMEQQECKNKYLVYLSFMDKHFLIIFIIGIARISKKQSNFLRYAVVQDILPYKIIIFSQMLNKKKLK